jgi:hypothetical protein
VSAKSSVTELDTPTWHSRRPSHAAEEGEEQVGVFTQDAVRLDCVLGKPSG